MGKSSPSPPPVPDPVATASAQGTANVQTAVANTALQNANTYTPYGQTTYTQTGTQQITQPDGSISNVPTYSVHQELSNQQRALLDQNENLSYGLNDTAQQALGRISDTMENPITADQLGSIASNVGATPLLQYGYNQGQARTSYDTGPALNYGYDSGGAIARGYDSGGAIQGDVNLNTNSPTSFGQTRNGVQYFQPGDFSSARDGATQAVLQRLAPTMAAQDEAQNAQLAAQGLVQGSAAWNAAKLSQNQANNDLRLGAVQTGDQEQQALFGQQATANQLYNAAQSQDYGQQLGRGQFAQSGIAANNAAALAQGQFHNAAQAQGNAQNAAAAAFANSAQDQANRQNAAAAGYYNQAVGQQNAQNAAAASFYNSGVGQQAAQNAALAAFTNSAANQDYQNRLSAGSFNNSSVGQQLALATALQNQQINQISALRSGNQVTLPAGQAYQGGTIDQTPISADTYQSAALANQQYQAQLQASAQNQAAMGSALGGIFGGIGRKSDRRLKSEVARVATARNGLPIYRYRLAGQNGWEVGMMADEVALLRPGAVWTDPSDGWARVDYEGAVL